MASSPETTDCPKCWNPGACEASGRCLRTPPQETTPSAAALDAACALSPADPEARRVAVALRLAAEAPALRNGLVAAIRAANLALFIMQRRGVEMNDSWRAGFDRDVAEAKAALGIEDEPALPPPDEWTPRYKHVGMGYVITQRGDGTSTIEPYRTD